MFIEFIRGVPLITLLFFGMVMLPLFLPEGINMDGLARVLVAVTLFQSAYMAEVIRGGLQAIPQGQYEAARSIGLSYWQMNMKVVLPQAIRISIPSIVNTLCGGLKESFIKNNLRKIKSSVLNKFPRGCSLTSINLENDKFAAN